MPALFPTCPSLAAAMLSAFGAQLCPGAVACRESSGAPLLGVCPEVTQKGPQRMFPADRGVGGAAGAVSTAAGGWLGVPGSALPRESSVLEVGLDESSGHVAESCDTGCGVRG